MEKGKGKKEKKQEPLGRFRVGVEALRRTHEEKNENWSFSVEQPGRAAWWVILIGAAAHEF
ncbi:hypothetical protein F2Q68_00026412 [Brassica cretica]|uniref:Uncharacterized protein n=1 Tax=Brassica cretica TaxID=69181 RepID=A0A8S9IFF4_BRACR|nr:hypothetical protein F2Q68_00026412 [Brassica cretica]